MRKTAKKKVYAYLHTHWDREWYRSKEDFNIRLLDVLDTVLDELKKDKAPFFYLDGQVIALLDYLKYRPNKEKEIANLIKNKRLAIGPYFVSADSYLVSYPSMKKNLELGLKVSQKYNQKDFIGYMSDIFGVSRAAFKALEEKNINKAIIWRGVNPKSINNNCNFKYDNIDTVWLVQGYFNDFCHSYQKTKDIKYIEALEKYLDKIAKYSKDNLLLPIGADHLGILKDATKTINEINKKLESYEIILTSPFEYFKHNKFNNQIKTVEFLDNSDTYILPGVYSARIYQKAKNVEIQNKIDNILAPLNSLLKEKYESNIDEIYKTLIKNHAHDGIYGCSLDCVQKSVQSRLEKCDMAQEAIINAIKRNFKKKYSIEKISKNELGLFNLSHHNNIKTVEISLPYILNNAQVLDKENKFPQNLLDDIYHIPVTEEIAPIYRQLVEISSNNKMNFNSVQIKKPIKKVKITKEKIENDNIAFVFKKSKIEVVNKKTKESYIFKLIDTKDDGDSYNFSPIGEEKELKPLKTKILYEGNIECALLIEFKDIKLEIRLNNHSEFLNFRALINNKTKNHRLQGVIELKNPIKEALFEDSYDIVKRKIDSEYDIRKYMPAKRSDKPSELRTNTYPIKNFVIAQNVIVLTKGLHEIEFKGKKLAFTLLRSFNTISNPKNKTRAIPAGPNLLTPEGQCLGINKADFALCFGSISNAYINNDEFFKNYVTIDGKYNKQIKI